MKEKDEISKEARKFWPFSAACNYFASYEEVIIRMSNFTHSQLKEQQEEIELLKAENETLKKIAKAKQKEVDELSEGLRKIETMRREGFFHFVHSFDEDRYEEIIEQLLK
jgi:Tfp pilus assembly protein PilO